MSLGEFRERMGPPRSSNEWKLSFPHLLPELPEASHESRQRTQATVLE